MVAGVASVGTMTRNGTSACECGARLNAEIDGVSHVPAFFTGASRLAYTAPEVCPVSPSTGETSSTRRIAGARHDHLVAVGLAGCEDGLEVGAAGGLVGVRVGGGRAKPPPVGSANTAGPLTVTTTAARTATAPSVRRIAWVRSSPRYGPLTSEMVHVDVYVPANVVAGMLELPARRDGLVPHPGVTAPLKTFVAVGAVDPTGSVYG